MATETLTHAITVHQPWAWALATGHKPVENRTWRPGLEHIGKLVGIHAGRSARRDVLGDYLAVATAMGSLKTLPSMSALPLGALIGAARLVGVVRRHPECGNYHLSRSGGGWGEALSVNSTSRIRPWWRGPLGWLFEEAVLLPEPIPMRGQQGLWRLPEEVRDGRRWGTDGDGNGAVAQRALEQWRKAREEKR